MKSIISVGVALLSIMIAPLAAMAGSDWTSDTSCIYIVYSQSNDAWDGDEVSCTVKYTPWSVCTGYYKEWDIKMGGHVFEVLKKSDGTYYFSAEDLSAAIPVNYSVEFDGYYCWVDARESPEFLICYAK